ncbi:MAG: nucleotidyltransferase family protein [Armatimonadota bacterium]|nr:nucleotidyltransferase family protein [Armatimonadota bacterium]
MNRDEALRLLAREQGKLAEFGVSSVSLFGSHARDEASASSDIDVLVEFAQPVGLFRFLDVKEYLERLMGCGVDLVTKDALKPQLRTRILEEAVHVF